MGEGLGVRVAASLDTQASHLRDYVARLGTIGTIHVFDRGHSAQI
jgi:hypothetical protein